MRDDEDALHRAIIELITEYERYGYRRVTALLCQRGWQVKHALAQEAGAAPPSDAGVRSDSHFHPDCPRNGEIPNTDGRFPDSEWGLTANGRYATPPLGEGGRSIEALLLEMHTARVEHIPNRSGRRHRPTGSDRNGVFSAPGICWRCGPAPGMRTVAVSPSATLGG